MAFDNITMNLTALRDISSPTINVSDSGILSSIVREANVYANNYIIFGSLFIILVVLYLVLSDKTALGDFGFDDLRALSLSLGVCIIFGLKIVLVAWSTNFFAVGVFGTAWFISFIIIMIYENQE